MTTGRVSSPPGRRTNRFPTPSTRTRQPASSAQRDSSLRPAISASVSAWRLQPPWGVAPISAICISRDHNRSPFTRSALTIGRSLSNRTLPLAFAGLGRSMIARRRQLAQTFTATLYDASRAHLSRPQSSRRIVHGRFHGLWRGPAATRALVTAFWLSAPLILLGGAAIKRFGAARLLIAGILVEAVCVAL